MCWKAFARALGLLEVGFELEASAAVEADAKSDMVGVVGKRRFGWFQGGGTSSTTCSVEMRMFRDI